MSNQPEPEQHGVLVCSNCGERIDYQTSPPRFCSSCGRELSAKPSPATIDPTPLSGWATRPSEAATLMPAAPGDPVGEEIPETIGNYRLLRRLGSGGMGTVFEAAEVSSGRHVALKLISSGFAASGESVERFRQEGRLASKIVHPRCVFVLAADEDRGRPYIVMELMPGNTLSDLVRNDGPLPPEQAVRKILDVIDGLNEAHEVGLIHRDVKPGNCFLQADGRVKIGDFGLAKSLLRPSHLTRTGTFLGTPLFAAPEQIKGEGSTVEDDVYSVAATLYFMLTGQAPFQSGDIMATMARILSDDPPSMRKLRPSLPRTLDQVVLRGLARERKNRWRSLQQFRRALVHQLPAEVSVGGLGLRFGAFVADSFAISLIQQAIIAAGMAVLGAGGLLNALALVAMSGTEVFYFGLLEGLFGWTVGKRLLRLRVAGRITQQPPGVKRALLRALIFYLAPNLASLAVSLYVWVEHPEHVKVGPEGFTIHVEADVMPTERVLVAISGAWYVLGFVALLATMRKRNGFRGLHEFGSGTRTYLVRWPTSRRRRALDTGQFDVPLLQPDGLPDKLGTYAIRGAFRWTSGDKLLRAQDPQLDRAVWIWLRAPSAAAIGATHRAIHRASRARWLASGMYEADQWDAFLAPSGCPLPALVARNGRLSWSEFRPLLEQLTDELHEACLDNSLPQSLSAEQVWVSPKGQLQLLETSCNAVDNPPGCQQATSAEGPALALLSEAAALALEGKPRSGGEPAHLIQAPLPLHARNLVDGLMVRGENEQRRYQRVDEFQADLKGTERQPAEVSPWARAKQLMGQAAYALICLVTIVITLSLKRKSATGLEPWDLIAAVLIGAACVLAPACLLRGGISYLIAGIVIVLGDGRRASRLRCLARALAAWGVVIALGLGTWAGVEYLNFVPLRQLTIPLLAVALLAMYAYLIMRSPSRAPHDHLVRTFLVPK